jgi:hypothetical protein
VILIDLWLEWEEWEQQEKEEKEEKENKKMRRMHLNVQPRELADDGSLRPSRQAVVA